MTCDYSHIYDSGSWEIAAMPDKSTIADKFGCKTRGARPDIVDEKAGYAGTLAEPDPHWLGTSAAPGHREDVGLSGCQRVVADVLRLDKGHRRARTEGDGGDRQVDGLAKGAARSDNNREVEMGRRSASRGCRCRCSDRLCRACGGPERGNAAEDDRPDGAPHC